MTISKTTSRGTRTRPSSTREKALRDLRKIAKQEPKKLQDYPPELRGQPQNKYKGFRTVTLRTYGGKFGRAGPVHRYSKDEVQNLEEGLRMQGLLDPSSSWRPPERTEFDFDRLLELFVGDFAGMPTAGFSYLQWEEHPNLAFEEATMAQLQKEWER